jgi:hypothetical protein
MRHETDTQNFSNQGPYDADEVFPETRGWNTWLQKSVSNLLNKPSHSAQSIGTLSPSWTRFFGSSLQRKYGVAAVFFFSSETGKPERYNSRREFAAAHTA